MGKPRSSSHAHAPPRARALRLIAAASAALAAACGGKPSPAGPPVAPPPGGKQLAPFAIRQEAKAPHQAVILGTDPRDGSTLLPLVSAPAAGIVDALFVLRGGGPGAATSGTSPVQLAAVPSTGGAVQVGSSVKLPDEIGTRWRAGVWMSAVVAASTLGKDLTDLTLSASITALPTASPIASPTASPTAAPRGHIDGATASPRGHIDGATASGLLAAGFLATITGAEIDPTATLTGMINPDGTIGPVAGVPEQLQVALDQGKRRLGYPIGLRMARSAATGEIIDLVQLARARGAEAIAIGSVQDAYRLLTRRQLPEPVPVAEAEMALEAATAKALDGTYREWQKRLATKWAVSLLLQQGGNLPRLLLAMARHAQARGEAAEQLFRRGALAAAHGEVREAWVLAAAAADAFELLQKVQQGNVPAAVAALAELARVDRATRAVLEQLGAMRPATIGDHMRMLSAFQSALRGWSFQVLAAGEVQRARRHLEQLGGKRREALATPATADALVAAVTPALVLIGRAHAETLQAQQRLEHERGQTLDYTCSPPSVLRLAAGLQAAAATSVSYLDTLLAEPAARSAGAPQGAARARVALAEPDYLIAHLLAYLPAGDGLPQELKQAWGDDSLAWSLMSLAAAELAYVLSAELIAEHASLQVRTEPLSGIPGLPGLSGRTATVTHEQALAAMLERAERAARSSARAARIAMGAIPVQAKLAYQQASAKRDGATSDKLAALSLYWMASAHSRTAVMLARN